MQILIRYIAAAFVATIALAAGAIMWYPDTQFADYITLSLQLGTVTVLVLSAVALWKEDAFTDRGKGIMLRLFLIAVLVPTMFATAAYVHEVETSWSNGEIHWHADFEVFVDGERLDLIDPSNYCGQYSQESAYMCTLNDRVGITEYHEHNDMRIHLEGTFKHREEATLAAFFDTFQGELTNTELQFPTDDGMVEVAEDDGKTLKILVERGVGGDRHWCAIGDYGDDTCISHDTGEPAASPAEYVISPYQRNPSLDNPTLDTIFVIYDETSIDEALSDVREDGEYKGMGLQKGGEGY